MVYFIGLWLWLIWYYFWWMSDWLLLMMRIVSMIKFLKRIEKVVGGRLSYLLRMILIIWLWKLVGYVFMRKWLKVLWLWVLLRFLCIVMWFICKVCYVGDKVGRGLKMLLIVFWGCGSIGIWCMGFFFVSLLMIVIMCWFEFGDGFFVF